MQIIIDGQEYELVPKASKQSLSNTPEPSKEKDWEIVSFKYGGLLYQKEGGSFFSEDIFRYHITDEHLLLKKGEINSVRRLSDMEVFSVGDEVEWGKKCTIFQLFISSNNLMWCDLRYEDGSEYHNANIGSLDKLPSTKPAEQPMEDRIEVELSVGFNNNPKYNWTSHLYATGLIPKEKFPLIKQAIENVLNNAGSSIWLNMEEVNKLSEPTRSKIMDDFLKQIIESRQKTYTQEQLDKAIEKSFMAAREGRFVDELKRSSPYEYLRYPTLESYLSTLKK